MRTILTAISLLLFFLVTFPACLILLLLRKWKPRLSSKISQVIVSYGFRFIGFFIGMKRTVIGVENVPKDVPVLFTSNHKSIMDAVLAYITLPVTTGFISKKEMKKVPFLNLWMINVNCLFLDRDDLRAGLKVILSCIDFIKSGTSMFIAPEGTRSHTDEPLPFKEGSFKPALKTGCPVIPVAISGTDELFENHKPWVKKHRVIIEYGKPIDLKTIPEEYKKQPAVYVREVVMQMLQNHKALLSDGQKKRK